jgi:hypothetical protein
MFIHVTLEESRTYLIMLPRSNYQVKTRWVISMVLFQMRGGKATAIATNQYGSSM